MEEGPGLVRHVALSLPTLVGWPLSFALLMSTTLLTVWITEIRCKGTLEHSMIDLPGSLQAKRIEGGRSVRSFVLPSFVPSSVPRSLERIEKRNAAVPDLQFGGDGWLPHGMVG